MTCDQVSGPLNPSFGPIVFSQVLTQTQQRPCNRCIKRSIGHLCHDAPREAQRKSTRLSSRRDTDTASSVAQPAVVTTDVPTQSLQQNVQPDVTAEVASGSVSEQAASHPSQLGQNAATDPLGSLNHTSKPFSWTHGPTRILILINLLSKIFPMTNGALVRIPLQICQIRLTAIICSALPR